MRCFSTWKVIYYFVCNSSLFIIEIPIYGSHN
nr:MAG TPA: hypothetical protein [Caudoviricetes sp.]